MADKPTEIQTDEGFEQFCLSSMMAVFTEKGLLTEGRDRAVGGPVRGNLSMRGGSWTFDISIDEEAGKKLRAHLMATIQVRGIMEQDKFTARLRGKVISVLGKGLS